MHLLFSQESTKWWFLLLLASLLPSVFTVLVWGPITDLIGRRRAMFMVPLINATRSLVYLVNAYFVESHVAYLLFGSFLSCFYGEFQGVVALCYAYLADVTAQDLDQRTMRMAFIEASLFFAGIPAGLLSGYLLERLGFVSVFGLNVGINLMILLYVIFYLPKDGQEINYDKFSDNSTKLNESPRHSLDASPSDAGDRGMSQTGEAHSQVISPTPITPSSTTTTTNTSDSTLRTSSFDDEGGDISITRSGGKHLGNESNSPLKKSSTYESIINDSSTSNRDEISCGQLFNPFSHLQHVFKVVMSPSCRAVVIPVILSFGFSVCAVYGELVVQTLYLTNQPFAFHSRTIGYYSAVQSGLRGVGVIVLTQLSYRVFHFTDYTLIIVGILSQILCYVAIGVARTPLSVFLVNIAGVGIPVATTTLRSLATKNVSSENYGAVLASLEAMDALAGVLTNACTLWTYNLTLHIYSGIAYFALAAFALLSLIFLGLGYFLRRRSLDNRGE